MQRIKNKIKNDFWKIVFVITIFFSGFLIGKLFDIPDIEVDKHVNPLHAFSILVTLMVAITISVFFQKNKDINNAANEIIIKRIDKVVDMLDTLNDLILEGSIEVAKAPSILKRIYGSLKCIDQSLKDYSINISVKFEDISQKHREIKDLVTNTPAHTNGKSSTPVKVENEKYVYNSARISQIGKNVEDLKNSLFKAQLEVNKSFRNWQ